MAAVTWILAAALSQQPATPAPQPFPRPRGGQPVVQPAPPPTSSSQPIQGAPTESALGVPLYPGAQFLASYDAGRGQRFYLYGTTSPFLDIVAYYRTVLKQKGELVFDAPGTHSFEVGRFREETMAFPPGVTIKDFQSQVSQGFPNPRIGAQPSRFPTVIQIVPVVPEK
jgi:hypothetical protein